MVFYYDFSVDVLEGRDGTGKRKGGWMDGHDMT